MAKLKITAIVISYRLGDGKSAIEHVDPKLIAGIPIISPSFTATRNIAIEEESLLLWMAIGFAGIIFAVALLLVLWYEWDGSFKESITSTMSFKSWRN